MEEVSETQYARFIAAVNTNFRRFQGKDFSFIAVDEFVYYFRIIDFGEYEIIKVEINYG